MNILITGGCGFIGSHIADRLIGMGHAVSVIDNLSTGNIRNLNPEVRFYQLDIRDRKIGNVFKKERPEVLFHLAAQINVRKSEEDPFLDTDININGSVNILRNFMETPGKKKVVFASTGGAIYGDTVRLPTPETVEPFPLCPYGISKLAVEKYLFYYSSLNEIDFAALRFGNVYGPRQNAHSEAGVVAIFTQKMLNRERPVIYGDGKQTRDFVYVEDVVEASIKAMGRGIEGVFNVGTGIETDINSVFDSIKKATCSNTDKIYAEAKKGEVKRSCLSCEKLKKTAGWKPARSFEEGIGKTVLWLRSVGC
ncbi:MAG TPA: NAD-dependent epimerase/dehydratase family protein [bacterium]|nr:NAD-dependent epimerase/dehydratase family protein [bacterium]